MQIDTLDNLKAEAIQAVNFLRIVRHHMKFRQARIAVGIDGIKALLDGTKSNLHKILDAILCPILNLVP